MEKDNGKASRRAVFLEKKKLQREAETKSTAQIIDEARTLFESDGIRQFFKEIAEKDR